MQAGQAKLPPKWRELLPSPAIPKQNLVPTAAKRPTNTHSRERPSGGAACARACAPAAAPTSGCASVPRGHKDARPLAAPQEAARVRPAEPRVPLDPPCRNGTARRYPQQRSRLRRSLVERPSELPSIATATEHNVQGCHHVDGAAKQPPAIRPALRFLQRPASARSAARRSRHSASTMSRSRFTEAAIASRSSTPIS